MIRLTCILLIAIPIAAQEIFPRFSVIAGGSAGDYESNVRIDPDDASTEGTLVSFERDLGLEDSQTLPRFALQWRPFDRHELGVAHFAASREGFASIDREIVFRDETYRAQADVTTAFDLDSWTATYTYWMRKTPRGGAGITVGVATLAFDASVTAVQPGGSVTITQEANTDVPVALAGLQARVAFTEKLHGEASVATLPRVTIEDYTGSALTGTARVEYRALRWLGIGAAYHYFDLDVDVSAIDLRGTLEMRVSGPEAYLRLAF